MTGSGAAGSAQSACPVRFAKVASHRRPDGRRWEANAQILLLCQVSKATQIAWVAHY